GEDVPAVQLYVLYSLNCSCGFESVVTFWANPPAVMVSAIVKVHSVRISMRSSGAHHACKMDSKRVRARCRSRRRDSGDSLHAVSRCQRSEPRLDALVRLRRGGGTGRRTGLDSRLGTRCSLAIESDVTAGD